MTSDSFLIMLMALIGAAIGALYFGLLWVAVRRLARHGGTMGFVLLGLVRLALAAGAVATVFMLDLPLVGLAAAGMGFMLVRMALTRAADPASGATRWR